VPRALIATLPPAAGGVPAMLRTAMRFLAEKGYEIEVAWYEPYSISPELSVPLQRIGTKSVASDERPLAGALAGHAIGAFLPELEVTHYRATALWRELIRRSELHFVVSGTAIAARAFAEAGVPYLAWLASDWEGDRKDRARAFPWHRRLVDAAVVRPLARSLEPRLLRAGTIVALSEPTRRTLDAVAGRPVVRAVMPQPIDLDRFFVEPASVVPGRIGFVGRFDDPRKNFALFLDALALARERSRTITAEIIGRAPLDGHHDAVEKRGLRGAVHFAGELPRPQYEARMRTLDVLCLTSHQEGLGIAALEAMACGAPVVATRCGGPEEFVEEGENGFLTGFSAVEIARGLERIVEGRTLRSRLSVAARTTVEQRYSWATLRPTFDSGFAELEDRVERERHHRSSVADDPVPIGRGSR
jgi:glycosyltransferase involved in cell wall biosynthesis